MAANLQQYIKLAQSLPPRLTRFFARYPPQAIVGASTSDSSTPGSSEPTQGQDGLTVPSPFRAQKHPVTGRWHDPVFSLRRQADLVKLAREHGVEELLPHSVKSTEYRLQRRMENGLRVKGTGIGQRVKGKESERMMKGRYVWVFLWWSLEIWNFGEITNADMFCFRLEKRRQAMLEMPAMIQEWKEVCLSCYFDGGRLICGIERTWSWVEEMAQISCILETEHYQEVTDLIYQLDLYKNYIAIRSMGMALRQGHQGAHLYHTFSGSNQNPLQTFSSPHSSLSVSGC
jgi:large subunit ribosomal protein L25